jgi:hypothetical protein
MKDIVFLRTAVPSACGNVCSRLFCENVSYLQVSPWFLLFAWVNLSWRMVL